MVNDDNPRLISIKDASTYVFNEPEHRITTSSILTWMSIGLFIPLIRAEPKNPRGSKLDEADNTVLSILRQLSYSGVRFGTRPTLRDQLAARFNFDEPVLSSKQIAELRAENKRGGRALQHYFEWRNYNVWIEVTVDVLAVPEVSRSSITMHRIWCFDQEKLSENLAKMIVNPGFSNHAYISVRAHYEYVAAKIRGIPK